LRDRYEEIRELGADVVVIGTGDVRYARAFVQDERIPFPVLVDDDAQAARAADVERVGLTRLFALGSLPATARALRRGHRLGRPGRRVNQLGATLVVAPAPAAGGAEPGARLLYHHRDAHPADHAPIAAVLDALRRARAEARA
jgi:hypothetical protein